MTACARAGAVVHSVAPRQSKAVTAKRLVIFIGLLPRNSREAVNAISFFMLFFPCWRAFIWGGLHLANATLATSILLFWPGASCAPQPVSESTFPAIEALSPLPEASQWWSVGRGSILENFSSALLPVSASKQKAGGRPIQAWDTRWTHSFTLRDRGYHVIP